MHKLSILGADISSLKKSEDCGGIYAYEDGTQADALKILKDHGMNYARIRVWVNSADGYHGKLQLLEIAKRLKEYEIKLLVDFHYSDTWADPAKQFKPATWANLDFDGLKKAVYEHTYDVCNSLKEQGTLPDMVQVGNEITNGMLWEDGKNDKSFDNLAELLKAGGRAVKDCSPNTLVMLHLDNGGNNAMYRHWFDNITKREVPFDLIGVSYYPYWHGTLTDFQNNLNDIALRYNKDIVVVETAYPFTAQDKDNFANVIQDQVVPNYDFTPEGQYKMLSAIIDIIRSVPNKRGIGFMWWDATWTAVDGNGWDPADSSAGNGWENQALFDFNNRALPAMKLFNQTYMKNKIFETPHRRINQLTGESVLVSPHRAKRPWLGQVEKTQIENLPHYDPTCYLCPRNERAGGLINPDYDSTFSFDNDFAALLPDETPQHASNHPLLATVSERGLCRVICFSPRHDLTLPELDISSIEKVITTWTEQTVDLSKKDFIHYAQVFENKGAMMGCSNPHPHSQIWGTELIPNEPAKELEKQQDYFNQNNRTLLSDYLVEEHKSKERILFANEHFTVLVPFWAVWPFETMLIAHRNISYLSELTSSEISSLAEAMKQITTRYDNLFEISFPYSMGFHQAPFDNQPHPEWTLHAHFYPPLLRSATVRKFMVGYEMLAMPQRDITPESAAERLRSLSDVHYKLKQS